MVTSLIASGSCSSGLAFAFLLLLLLKVSSGSQVLGCLEIQTDKSGQEKTDDRRRDELVHLLHSLRLPCPHNNNDDDDNNDDGNTINAIRHALTTMMMPFWHHYRCCSMPTVE
jgi:hypothetical protein